MNANSIIPIEKINHVYSGRDGKCCCGCAGTHSRSPRTIKTILRKMEKLSIDKISYNCFSAVIGDRLYIAYVDKPTLPVA